MYDAKAGVEVENSESNHCGPNSVATQALSCIFKLRFPVDEGRNKRQKLSNCQSCQTKLNVRQLEPKSRSNGPVQNGSCQLFTWMAFGYNHHPHPHLPGQQLRVNSCILLSIRSAIRSVFTSLNLGRRYGTKQRDNLILTLHGNKPSVNPLYTT